ncbi:hypothetical protein [Bradyrhizobium sp. Leo170]|uniref:hypothetical protein n=1 Tax=Bradyrhizobium sp. Leo170 TaxID=1571199 RepID=UPI00102E42B9|nr:hypothetical protein [Bradyrhizobium sp. Leo170]
MVKNAKSPLHVVSNLDGTGPKPSRSLGEHGLSLWNRVTAEYDVSDVAGVELLTLAGQTLDRAEALAERIAADGEIVRTPTGIKCHPAVKEELACRAFVVRTLQKLGLNYEPLRASPGRPPAT